MRRFLLLLVAAVSLGACGSTHNPVHPAQPHPAFPLPPNWHPFPTAPPHGLNTFCVNGTECFRVDGNGYPYGTPTYGGNAPMGVRGVLG